MPLIVALDVIFVPEPDSLTLLKVYANGAIVWSPDELKFTVPVEAVNVPAAPLIKVPPAFIIPAPENMILEEVPAEVILPETVTVPVDIVTELLREVVD